MTTFAGRPASGTLSGLAAASMPPRSTAKPRSRWLVGAAAAVAVGGGQVPACDLALPHRVLRRHRGVLARPGQVGHRGGVSAGQHLGTARHGEELVDADPAALGRQAHVLHDRVGAHADTPDQRVRGHEVSAVQQHALVRGLLHRRPGHDLDPASSEHLVGRLGKPLVQPWQDPVGDVQQQPARSAVARQRTVRLMVLPHQRVGEQRAVRGHLRAGVPGTDHDEGAARPPFLGIVARGGQRDLPGDVVAQVQRLGHAAESVCVLGDTRDGQQLVHAADGQHQPVVGELALLPLGVGVAHTRARRGRCRRPRPAPAAPRGSVPASDTETRRGSSRPVATCGQQRQVEEVVVGVDEQISAALPSYRDSVRAVW